MPANVSSVRNICKYALTAVVIPHNRLYKVPQFMSTFARKHVTSL